MAQIEDDEKDAPIAEFERFKLMQVDFEQKVFELSDRINQFHVENKNGKNH